MSFNDNIRQKRPGNYARELLRDKGEHAATSKPSRGAGSLLILRDISATSASVVTLFMLKPVDVSQCGKSPEPIVFEKVLTNKLLS